MSDQNSKAYKYCRRVKMTHQINQKPQSLLFRWAFLILLSFLRVPPPPTHHTRNRGANAGDDISGWFYQI